MTIQEGTEFIDDVENEETAETVLPDTSNDTVPAEPIDNQTTSTIDVEPEAPASDMSYNVASLFVLSMIVGLLVFHILSRRWQT